MSDKLFIKGTLILTLTGLVSRLMGFFYRIFLSHTIGAQGVGIYQLTLPVHAIVLAACCMGIQAAISRLCASFTALGKEKESRDALLLGTFLSMALCGLLSFLVNQNQVDHVNAANPGSLLKKQDKSWNSSRFSGIKNLFTHECKAEKGKLKARKRSRTAVRGSFNKAEATKSAFQ